MAAFCFQFLPACTEAEREVPDDSDHTGSDISIESSGNDSGGEGVDDICAESELSAELVATDLLFVVDKSGSMNCNAPPFDEQCHKPEKIALDQPSKWESTQRALVGISRDGAEQDGLLQVLSDLDGVNAGLLTFPTDDYCGVLPQGELNVAISSLDVSHVKNIESALDLIPEGETPFAGAAIRGLDLLRERVVAGRTEGRSYLVLMTDGVETCQPQALDDLRTYTKQARDYFDMSTYVVGAPGSENSRALLSEIAYLGGTARQADCKHDLDKIDQGDCHIDLTESEDFSTALSAAFSHIGKSTEKQCELDVPRDAFIDPNKVNVIYIDAAGGERTLLQDHADCVDMADGWQYPDGDNTRIVLCGEACRRLRSEAGAQVQVIFGCAPTLIR